MSILKIEDLTFAYSTDERNIFENYNMEFEKGVMYALTGKSGAGKTTLLSLLSALTKPTDGKILINEESIFDKDTYKYRCSDIGIVFQNYNLLPKLNAIENVMLSIDISGKKYPDKEKYAVDLLTQMGIDRYDMYRSVLQLSGGQQQRVAIARSISYDPSIILADEPTGNLDGETADEIMNIFAKLAHENGKCVIIVTHSPAVSEAADKVISIERVKTA